MVMMLLRFNKFFGKHKSVNGNRKVMLTETALMRSVITLGFRSRKSAYAKGRQYRIMELTGMIKDVIEVVNNDCRLSDGFQKRTPSDKNSASYQIAMGLTKLVAEHFFGIPWLLHLSDVKADIVLSQKRPHTKHRIYMKQIGKKPAEPDLVGYNAGLQPFVFESKGSSTGYSKREHQHAINQVSMVKAINGISRITRVACYFNLRAKGFVGRIIDPKVSVRPIEIDYRESDFIKAYYGFFLEDTIQENLITIRTGSLIWRGVEISPQLYFVIADGLHAPLRSRRIEEMRGLADICKETIASVENIRTSYPGKISVGLDGIGVIDAENLDPDVISYPLDPLVDPSFKIVSKAEVNPVGSFIVPGLKSSITEKQPLIIKRNLLF